MLRLAGFETVILAEFWTGDNNLTPGLGNQP